MNRSLSFQSCPLSIRKHLIANVPKKHISLNLGHRQYSAHLVDSPKVDPSCYKVYRYVVVDETSPDKDKCIAEVLIVDK